MMAGGGFIDGWTREREQVKENVMDMEMENVTKMEIEKEKQMDKEIDMDTKQYL